MSRAYEKLARRIAREYRKKGFSPKRAEYIGRATAGEVATKKHRRAKRRG